MTGKAAEDLRRRWIGMEAGGAATLSQPHQSIRLANPLMGIVPRRSGETSVISTQRWTRSKHAPQTEP